MREANPAAAYLRPFDIELELTRMQSDQLLLRLFVPFDRVEATILDGKRWRRHTLTGGEIRFLAPPPDRRVEVAVRFFGGPLDRQELRVAERVLPLEGAKNFRDLGGYPAMGGKRVRWGKVFRAESLAGLTPADGVWLRDRIGLRLVCDLRGMAERAAAPDRLERVDSLSLPMEPGAPGAMLAAKPDLGASYIQMIEERGESVYGPLLARLAEPKNLPLVFHCTAGKDRTGVGSALLLGLLGVSRKNIVADYALTNLSYPTLLANMQKNPTYAAMADKMLPLLVANPTWIEATLDHIDRKYDSIEAYLLKKTALDSRQIERIRTHLLT